MASDLKWNVVVDDREYTVRCVTQTSLFDIYVDEELAIRVPRKMKHDDTESEYDLRIGNKLCQFVVYDGVPDLCVDGILQSVQREMDHREKRNRWLLIFACMAIIIMSTYAIFLWYVYELAGQPFFGGYVALVLFFVLIIAAVTVLLWLIRRKNRS